LSFGDRDLRKWWCVSDAAAVGRFLHAVQTQRLALLRS
jgi:hypothetical protein